MLQQLSFIYLTAVLSFMLDLCYVHARSDSVRWRAAFEKCWVQTNFFWGGGGNNNPKTSLILWVEGKTCSPLARHPKVVGRCGYSCSSRSRFMKTKMHLAELDWKEQTEVCVLVFLTQACCNAELYMYIFPCSTLSCVSMEFEIQDYFYINAWES